MKLTPKLALMASAMLLSLCFSCKKAVEPRENVHEYLSSLTSPPQIFMVASNTGGEIVGKLGTKLILPAGSFYYKENNHPAEGNVDVELVEIYSKGDMILHDRPSESNGELLESGGEIYLKMKIDGEEVYSKNSMVKFPAPSSSNTPMQIFGWDDMKSTWTTNGCMAVPAISDGGNTYYYTLPIPENYNWINCDYFLSNNSPKNPIYCSVKNSHEDGSQESSALVYMLLENFSVAKLSVAPHKDRFVFENCPVGIKYRLIAVTLHNQQVQVGITGFFTNSATAHTVEIHTHAMAENEFKNFLSNL